MHILTHASCNVSDRDELIQSAASTVKNTLGHLAVHIARVEIFLRYSNGEGDGRSSEAGGTSGCHGGSGAPAGKRCLIEAHLHRHQPYAVMHEAASFQEAIRGATENLAVFLNALLVSPAKPSRFATAVHLGYNYAGRCLERVSQVSFVW